MNKYMELKNKHEKMVNEFPMEFAFSDKQFKESMSRLGLGEEDTDKVVKVGAGGFIREEDAPKYVGLIKQIDKEKEEAIEADEDGSGFIKDMFLYELGNHEYGYTGDLGPTLEALGLTKREVFETEKLKRGLKLALDEYLKGEE